MAFGIGKKKDNTGDDWSNSAATPSNDPADSFAVSGTPPKKSLPPALLAGIAVLVLAVLGAGLYFFVLAPGEVEDTTPVTTPTEVATPPDVPVEPAPPADPAAQSAVPTPAPAPKPAAASKPAATTKPKPKPTPTPGVREGLTGQDGKGLEPGNTVLAVQAVSPALQAELNRLWLEGANAKWRKDYAGARRAWTKMLQLRPGHPGVQSAIDKLPR
jgi:outer membrane biosynthesis protein TonB